MSDRTRRNIVKAVATLSTLFLLTDFVYSKISNISYANREACILYRLLPRAGFLLMEYVLELAMLVFMGIFIATVLERYFSRFKRLYPRNVVTAFILASILPVCACSVIPLIRSLQGKLSFRSIITFVVSAPLLSPYIILLSLSVIGGGYTVLRILASFLLAVSAGWVLEFFHNRMDLRHNLQTGPILFAGAGCGEISACVSSKEACCRPPEKDIFLKTGAIFMEVLPYIAIAGAAGIALEFISPDRLLLDRDIDNSFLGVMAVVLVGVPIYFCSGVEILFLRPLMHTAGFSMGTAIAFSLSSTSICLTSAVMLLKFLGKGLTAILAAYLFTATLVIGYVMNLFLGR